MSEIQMEAGCACLIKIYVMATQKPKLSFWSDHNETMNYLSEFAKMKQNLLH